MRRPALATATVLAVTGALLTPAAAHADVADPVTITITSPVTDDTVAGQVPVTLHVTGDGTAHPGTVTVKLWNVADQRRVKTAAVDLTPDCATSCDMTVTLDTATWSDPGDDPDALETVLPDGTADLTATLVTDSDFYYAPGQRVTISNGQPVIAWPTGPVQALHGPAHVRYTVQGRGRDIDHVDVTILGDGIHRTTSLPAPAFDAFNNSIVEGDLDVTGLTDGQYTLRVVAFDVAGVASMAIQQALTVYAGPFAKAVAITPIMPVNGRGAVVTVKRTNGPGGYPYGVKKISVWVNRYPNPDGTWPAPDATSDDDITVVDDTTIKIPVPLPYDGPLKPGVANVRVAYTEYVYRDQYPANDRTETYTRTDTLPVGGIYMVFKVDGPVVEGLSGTLRASLTGVPGVVSGPLPTVLTWRAAEDFPEAPTLASGACSAGPDCWHVDAAIPLQSLRGSHPALPVGDRLHIIALTVTDSFGITRTETTRVNVDAKTRVTLLAPTRAAFGTKVKLTAAVQQSDNQMLPAAPVVFQARTIGTSTWRTVATVNTTSAGAATAYVTVSRNTAWRAVVAQRVGYYGPGTSASPVTAVPARVTVSGVPTTGTAGTSFTVRGAVAPANSGRVVYVQTRKYGSSTWRTVARPVTDRYGVARVALRLTRGTWYVRAVAGSVTSSASGVSAQVRTVQR